MLTARFPGTDAPRTVFGELQIKSLLDDPALRHSLGAADPVEEPIGRPANIRRLLELAAA